MLTRGMVRIGLAGVITTLVLTGCGPEDAPDDAPSAAPSTTSTPELVLGEGTFPDMDAIARDDASEVASATARSAHSWDTEFDKTQTDGLIRAKPLMSDDFAETIKSPERNAGQAEWLAAGEHEAYSVPQLAPSATDIQRDYGPNRKAFAYTVTYEWVGRDGETLDGELRKNVQVFVERDGPGSDWEVVGYVSDVLS